MRQGKLRGLEFKPLFFRFENHSCEAIKDKKGREVIIPTLVPLSIAKSAIRIVEKKQAKKGEPTKSQIMQKAILDAYDILAENGERSTGLNGKPVVKVSVKALTAEVKSRGFLGTDEKGNVDATSLSNFRHAKSKPINANKIIENDGLIWAP